MKLFKQIRTLKKKKIGIHKNRRICPFKPQTHNLPTGNKALQTLATWYFCSGKKYFYVILNMFSNVKFKGRTLKE